MHFDVFIRPDETPKRDGLTDRLTDRSALVMTALCIASNADAL